MDIKKTVVTRRGRRFFCFNAFQCRSATANGDIVTIDFCEQVITMSDVIQKRVIRTPEFVTWLDSLDDQIGKGAVVDRIDRMKSGLRGTVRDLKDGLREAKVDVGPGYRIYYSEASNTIILLLLGGDKSRQKSDVRKAKKMLAALTAKQRAAKKAREEEGKKAAIAAGKHSRSKTKPNRK